MSCGSSPAIAKATRFSEVDKLVLDDATAISRNAGEVDESVFERLCSELDDAQIVELTT